MVNRSLQRLEYMDIYDWVVISRKGVKRDFLSCISYNDLPSIGLLLEGP